MIDVIEYTMKRIMGPLSLKPSLKETLSYATWEGFSLPEQFYPFWHARYIPGARIQIHLLHGHGPYIKTKVIHWDIIEPIANKVFMEKSGQLSLF